MKDTSSSDRWLLSSHLQKAIRRGKTQDALYAAQKLEKTHPEYLRRRLRVIGLEDVGIGAPELVSSYLQRSLNCTYADIADTIINFSNAPKDRNGAEILRAAGLHFWFEPDRNYVMQLNPQSLAEIVLQQDRSLYLRTLAAWMLAGTSRVPSVTLKSNHHDFKLFLATMQALDVPPSIQSLYTLGTNAKDYGLGLGCTFAWLHARAHTQEAIVEPLFNDAKTKKLLLCAIDSHTRPGLASIKRFATECEPLRLFLTSEFGPGIKRHMRYIAAMLFYIEGANVACRLTYINWQRPFQRGIEGELFTTKFGVTQLQMLQQLICQHIELLNTIRKAEEW